MRRGSLSPLDVIMVITYFTSAGMHYQAGLPGAGLTSIGRGPDYDENEDA
jgi:hypothetical protein